MAEGELQVGDKIPVFLVKDHEGYDVSDEDVIGTALVIYFFPPEDLVKNKKHARSFQENLEKFDHLQTLILGVTSDSVGSIQKFAKQNTLDFSLLSDEKKDMCHMFGVIKDGKIERATFVVNSRGVIKWKEQPVKLEGHTDRVLKAIEKYCQDSIIKYDDFGQDYAEFLKESLEITEDEKSLEKKIMKEFGIKDSDLE